MAATVNITLGEVAEHLRTWSGFSAVSRNREVNSPDHHHFKARDREGNLVDVRVERCPDGEGHLNVFSTDSGTDSWEWVDAIKV